MSGPQFGYCPVDRDWTKETDGNPQSGRDWVRGMCILSLSSSYALLKSFENKKIACFFLTLSRTH